MRRIQFREGDDFVLGRLCVYGPTGALTDADATPTVEYHSEIGGIATAGVVQSVDTGIYQAVVSAAAIIAADGYSAEWTPLWRWSVGGIEQAQFGTSVEFVPRREWATVVTDGGNAAGSFKVAAINAFPDADDEPIYALCRVVTGAMAGAVRPITDYVNSTGFLTVTPAFPATPADGVFIEFITH